ncbi:16505_t:CDS:2, partial [Dentiscutata erythropus]
MVCILYKRKSLETFAANNSYANVNATITNQMLNAWPACEQAIIKCNKAKTSADCLYAEKVCQETNTSYAAYFLNAGLSVYDVRAPIASVNDILSPDYVNYITKPEVLQAIGASNKIEYLVCSEKVQYNLLAEEPLDFSSKLEFLLQKGVKTLIYHGGLEMCLNLNWKHKSKFSSAPMKEWFVDGTSAGQVKCTDILSFVTIYQAGHEAPLYQPKSTLDMFKK